MRIKFRKLTALLAILMVLTSAFGSIFSVGSASSVALGDAIGAAVYYNDDSALQTAKLNSIDLYPGGMPFGVKFFTSGVLIVGFCDIDNGSGTQNPARSAGLQLKDVITEINGQELTCAAQLTTTIENSGGKAISLTYTREGKEHTVEVTPIFSHADGRYKTGIWVRDSGAGIGTVTFISPEDQSFAGLGHGICDNDTGEVIPMQRGIVTEVTISGITKGVPGDPGEIKGYFNSGKCGTLLKNTDLGVYGIFAQLPAECPEGPLPAASRDQVKEGDAYIWCTLDTNEINKYSVSISNINYGSDSNKCFTVTITDPALLEKTGGIIQGMSGSPIIQDGLIIGAVTHVLINDPTTGYGIFIENMLGQMDGLTE